jgi:hypothetical protein
MHFFLLQNGKYGSEKESLQNDITTTQESLYRKIISPYNTRAKIESQIPITICFVFFHSSLPALSLKNHVPPPNSTPNAIFKYSRLGCRLFTTATVTNNLEVHATRWVAHECPVVERVGCCANTRRTVASTACFQSRGVEFPNLITIWIFIFVSV